MQLKTNPCTACLQENQGGATPWVIGALVLGGVVWWLSSSSKASASTPSPSCPITDEMLGKLRAAKNYVVYSSDQTVSTWRDPKVSKIGYGEPNARYWSTEKCSFYRWDGAAWVVDAATDQELAKQIGASVQGTPHPAELFLF